MQLDPHELTLNGTWCMVSMVILNIQSMETLDLTLSPEIEL
jgi:hypothetical protein